jgi:RNA polymerase sigma factor (sigma-70 family)
MNRSVLHHVVQQLKQQVDCPSSNNLSDQELLTRFCTNREETAFTLLVQRHGPMILGLCHRLIQDHHLAEDIFQATFLVLIRRRESIQKRSSLVSWLYGVAYRIAQKTRLKASRFVVTDFLRDIPMSKVGSLDELSVEELREVLDSAIHQLPEKYRLPILLCYVQKKTQEEAALELRCPKSSLVSRLTRGRELLQEYLSHRGYTLPSTTLIALVNSDSLQSSISDSLLLNTIQSVTQLLSGNPVQATSALALANTFLRKTWMTKFITGCLFLFSLGMLTGTLLLANSKDPLDENHSPITQAKSESREEENQAKPHLDQFGDSLPKDALARLGTVRLRHGGQVQRAVLFSDDGKTLISVAGELMGDRRIRFWDIQNGKEIHKIETRYPPHRIALGLGGKTIVGWSYAKQEGLYVWDIATGKQVKYIPYPRPPDAHSAMILSPDRKHVILSNHHHEIVFVDLTTGEESFKLQGHGGTVEVFAISPDGTRLVSASADDSVRLWSIKDRMKIQQFDFPQEQRKFLIKGIDFSPDGKSLAVWGFGGLSILDIDSGKEIRWVKKDWQSVFLLPNDRLLVGNQIENLKTGKVEKTIAPVQDRYVLSPNKDLLVGFGYQAPSIWEVKTGKPLFTFNAHSSVPGALTFSPDGKRIFSGSYREPFIRVWDGRSGKFLGTWDRIGDQDRSGSDALVISPNGKILVDVSSTINQGTIRLWDLDTGKEIRNFPSFQRSHQSIVFLPDGKHLLSTGSHLYTIGINEEEAIRVWEVATGKQVLVANVPNGTQKAITTAPDGKTFSIAVGGRGDEKVYSVLTFDLATGKELRRLNWDMSMVYELSFHPDGNQLAFVRSASGNRCRVEMFDIRTGKPTRTITVNDAPCLYQIAFSPDGRSFALSSGNGQIHLVETSTGLERRDSFEGHLGKISRLAFSPDGNRLLSGSYDTTGLIWDLTGYHGQSILPDSKQLETWWEDLASSDAKKAYRAICGYIASGKPSVEFLSKQVKPLTAEDGKQLTELVQQLGNNRFIVRQKADRALRARGVEIEGFLRKISQQKWDVDTQERLEKILEELPQVQTPEGLRSLRVLEILERMNIPESRSLFEMLPSREAKASQERLQRR